ncbi:hypothetical protein SAV14893_087050 [Streptomyces avermitilis]|uniref:Uncharacterized protein n=1 Tax=Streptomyces avermitilis TaxID=33903 RepID=A0A4D4MBK2_STRAX|nr:hypothetical protein SAV14893_087050 [Streptomyces avermitilis]
MPLAEARGLSGLWGALACANALLVAGQHPSFRRHGSLLAVAVADGLYGYWPEAVRPDLGRLFLPRGTPALLTQARPGGKILLTLSGWLYGYARVLLTVADDGTAEGQLRGDTVSFMSARRHAAPTYGNPAHWATGLPEKARTTRHSPERITIATDEALHLRFLAQSAVSDAQMTTVGDVVHLVDVVTGSRDPHPWRGQLGCTRGGR